LQNKAIGAAFGVVLLVGTGAPRIIYAQTDLPAAVGEVSSQLSGKVTIEGPNATRTLNVQDPAMLDGVKVGDGVVARFRNEIIGDVK
jgi:hypothetical protein